MAVRARIRLPSWVRWLVVVTVSFGLVVTAATWRLFVKPSSSVPERADAAIVLSGAWRNRVNEGLRLLDEGVVSTLVFVGTPDSPSADELCNRATTASDVICLSPNPDTTRSEIRAAADLAESRDWESLVLVTSTYHVTRAGMLLRRCFSGQVSVVGTDLPAGIRLTPRVFAQEWAGVLRDSLIQRGC